MVSALLLSSKASLAPAFTAVSCSPRLPSRTNMLVCRAQKADEESHIAQKMALPFTAALAAALVMSAVAPEDALAARSGGRVGGSSFSSSRSSAPRSSAPRSGGPTVRNYTYNSYTAPPVLASPYGGGFGWGFARPSFFFVPSFGFGGFFNIIIFMFIASAVLSVVGSIARRNDRDDFRD